MRSSRNGRTSWIGLTTIFEAGDIVRAPFPYVEQRTIVVRPALVLTAKPVGPVGLLVWVAMITNAERAAWPGDIVIPDAVGLGLIIPSKVRTDKIVAVETAAVTAICKLDRVTLLQVQDRIRRHLGF